MTVGPGGEVEGDGYGVGEEGGEGGMDEGFGLRGNGVSKMVSLKVESGVWGERDNMYRSKGSWGRVEGGRRWVGLEGLVIGDEGGRGWEGSGIGDGGWDGSRIVDGGGEGSGTGDGGEGQGMEVKELGLGME